MKLSGRNFAILRFLVLVFSLRILSISPFWPAVVGPNQPKPRVYS
jgi:hypothetical protein